MPGTSVFPATCRRRAFVMTGIYVGVHPTKISLGYRGPPSSNPPVHGGDFDNFVFSIVPLAKEGNLFFNQGIISSMGYVSTGFFRKMEPSSMTGP